MDFEARSLIDLPRLGEHAYASHWSTSPLMLTIGTAPKGIRPTFEIIDFFRIPGYAENAYPQATTPGWGNFKVPCPPAILRAIERGDTFVAHNARFEQSLYYYICHEKWGWPLPQVWSCTAARSRYFGIRASLEGSASDLEVVTQKDARGKQFINDFCKPRKYKGAKKLGIVKDLWYEPHENPTGWQIGLEYCQIDGEAEADVDAILPDLPPFEQAAWDWDFKFNLRGVPIDVESVQRARQFSEHFTATAVKRFEDMTALRPTQRDRVLEYLQQREEIAEIGDLRSKTLRRLVAADFPADLQDIIQIRLDCSLASIKKLETMERCTGPDGRAKGGHLYGGAHTMRWSHKRIQTGNMKRGDAATQERIFEFLTGNIWADPFLYDGLPGWVDAANWRFMRPLKALSESMKGFIKAIPGHTLLDADFSQIEARVLAWLAREMGLLQAFRDKKDPYVKFACEHLYPAKYEDCFEYVNGKRQVVAHYRRPRQIAKSAVLGAGFGLGDRTFIEYCDNSDLIITPEESKNTIYVYRDANREIVRLWDRVEQCAVLAVANPGRTYALGETGVKFYIWHVDEQRYWLVIELPSGRCLHYYRPKLEAINRFGRTVEVVTFRKEWNGKSYREQTYGGRLTENIVQAIGRDILVVGGLKAEAAGYPTIMLVHDNNVTMPLKDHGSIEGLVAAMCDQEPWITDLPVEAEGKEMVRYG
jgi:DNA polymerase